MMESSIVKKANKELGMVVSKLSDTSFLPKGSLSVYSVSGTSEGKVCEISVRFKEKGSGSLRAALERLGWEKERREMSGTGFSRTFFDEKREFYLVYRKSISYFKYAIYRRGKNAAFGLYAMDYIDSMDDKRLGSMFGGGLVKEENLPVVVNGVGGSHSFDERYEEGFVEIVEVPEGEEPLTREQMYPKNSSDFFYGWISPNGDTYACGFEKHTDCADEIAREIGMKTFSAEYSLEEAGWIKVSRPAPYSYENMGKRTIYYKFRNGVDMTVAQMDTLIDTGLYEESADVRTAIMQLQGERGER